MCLLFSISEKNFGEVPNQKSDCLLSFGFGELFVEDRGWVAAGSHSGAVKGAELAEILLQKV